MHSEELADLQVFRLVHAAADPADVALPVLLPRQLHLLAHWSRKNLQTRKAFGVCFTQGDLQAFSIYVFWNITKYEGFCSVRTFAM